MKILVTGAAGFIGMHVSSRLIKLGHEIVGIDNLNDYYDVRLKLLRLKQLKSTKFKFVKMDILNKDKIFSLFSDQKFELVLHLAAQVGVRYSIDNPEAYVNSNILGFLNILEASRINKIKHLVYASSSSVYGLNQKLPYSENDLTDHPVSFYAATKKSNELMAHVYSNLYSLPTTGLRFFTVYGPWGRPDMALFLFAKSILEEKPIQVFNKGNLFRGFTYIDDIVEGLTQILFKFASSLDFNPNKPCSSISSAPYRLFNIGNSQKIPLMNYINRLEIEIGKKAIKQFLPMQKGDVKATAADTSLLFEYIDYCPNTSIEKGIKKFVEWYVNEYKNIC